MVQICPSCRGALEDNRTEYECSRCGEKYPKDTIDNDIII